MEMRPNRYPLKYETQVHGGWREWYTGESVERSRSLLSRDVGSPDITYVRTTSLWLTLYRLGRIEREAPPKRLHSRVAYEREPIAVYTFKYRSRNSYS